MSDEETQGISRRRVLQQGAIAGGVMAVGVTGFSGTALASFCPGTPGFWGNHDWCEVPVGTEPDSASVAESIGIDDGSDPCPDSEYCLGPPTVDPIECKTMSEWQSFLLMNAQGDKGIKMAQFLLATTLSFHRRPGNDTDCVLKEVDFSEFGLSETTTVGDVAARARRWLADSNWPDSAQRSWTVDGIDGEPLKNILDAFANGEIEELDCDCPSD